ncbi:MAG: polysaccharide biosynthesis tyrosine autokinase [Chitinivibrionales bacterium]|nr:polysaccharide biosynthesis tyrosine autokinase [Chitinivibrionales bacterium]
MNRLERNDPPQSTLPLQGRKTPPLVIHERFPGYVAELFRSLRAKVLFELRNEERRSVAVTSLESGAGKTTVSINLALSLAQRRVRTLMIDGDLRREGMSELLGKHTCPGLSEFLESGDPVTEEKVLPLVHREANSYFSFLPSGRPVQHSSELLGDGRFEKVMRILSSRFDVIVLDLPPIGQAVDPVVVQDAVRRYLLVAHAGVTNIIDLDRKLREYDTVRDKSLGIVLNRAALDRNLRYYKYSKYYSDNGK